jgi:hypothetical protein
MRQYPLFLSIFQRKSSKIVPLADRNDLSLWRGFLFNAGHITETCRDNASRSTGGCPANKPKQRRQE